jgi:hypothetical protein
VCLAGPRLAVQYCSFSETGVLLFSVFHTILSANPLSFMIGSASLLPRISIQGIYSQKRTARLSPAVQVKGGNALGGSDSGGGGYRLSGFANQKDPRIDEAQFLLTLLALALQISHRRRVGPCCCRSRRLRIMPLGLTNTLAPLFHRNASATNRPCVSASGSQAMAVILRSNMMDALLATSTQLKVPGRIGVTSGSPVFRPNIP